MDRDQFREYLNYLYNSDIRARLLDYRYSIRHVEHFDYQWIRIIEVSRILRSLTRQQ